MKRRLARIFLVLAGAGVLGGLAYAYREHEAGKRQKRRFSTHTIERGDVLFDVLATGKVQPLNRLEIKPPIGGRIEDVKVEEGKAVAKGQILAYMSSTDRAALLDLARSKSSEAVARLEDIFRATPVVAPLGGIVIDRNVEPGQMVAATDAAFVLSDRPIVVAQIDETDLGKVRIGQEVDITLDAYPKDLIKGQVSQIAYESKTVNNVTIYEIKIIPAKAPDFLRSGLTANVQFRVDERRGVVVVPLAFVKKEDHIASVVVAKNDPSAPSPDDNPGRLPESETREIVLGLSDGKKAEVVSGLTAGEVLINLVKDEDQGGGKGSNPFMPFGNMRKGGKR